jgi:hypothetical protein
MTAKIGRPVEPVLPRLVDRVTIGHETGCWIWTGSKTPSGRGLISVNGKYRLTHRVTYEMFRGPIPDGLVLDHLCRVPECCYPGHLEPVTHATNIARGMAPTTIAKRNGTCLSGRHDMTDVYVKKNGEKQCAPCHREKGKARYAK